MYKKNYTHRIIVTLIPHMFIVKFKLCFLIKIKYKKVHRDLNIFPFIFIAQNDKNLNGTLEYRNISYVAQDSLYVVIY